MAFLHVNPSEKNNINIIFKNSMECELYIFGTIANIVKLIIDSEIDMIAPFFEPKAIKFLQIVLFDLIGRSRININIPIKYKVNRIGKQLNINVIEHYLTNDRYDNNYYNI